MPKSLSTKDLNKYHEAMYEIDYILGETKIIFYPLLTSNENSLYKNTKRATYGEPIYLIGQIKFPTDASETTFEDSSKKDISVSVTLPLLSFSQYEHINEVEEEKTPIDPYSIVKGYFIIDSKKYIIDDCVPTGLFAGTYTSYTYMCKGVDII